MRIALVLLFLLHGFAHLVGFAGSFKLSPTIPYKTTVLAGHIEIGDTGMRAIGIGWLVLAIAFVVTGLAVLFALPAWPALAILVATISLVFCLLELPTAAVGALVNAAIIAFVLIGQRQAWWPA